MGLDMYLDAEIYVGGWSFAEEAERDKYQHLIHLVGLADLAAPSSPSVHVDVRVAYWRKANAIHGWFVKNVQNGKDECQRSYVARSQLTELLEVTKQALAAVDAGHPDAATALLPPQPGFFFGSMNVDEFYRQDLTDTIDQLTPIINSTKAFDLYYQASW